jgi:hypothetical protein
MVVAVEDAAAEQDLDGTPSDPVREKPQQLAEIDAA